MLRARSIGGCVLAAFLVGAAAAAVPAHAGENEDLNFAKKLRRDGMFVAAAEEFLRFTEKYPQSVLRPEALFTAAEAYLQAGKANDALGTYEKFIDQYPKDERACLSRLQRGRIFKALDRYREGANEFLTIPDESPACPVLDQALLEAGECLMLLGDTDGSIRTLRRLINDRKDSPFAPRARYTLALALFNAGRDLEGENVLGEIVSLYPKSPVRAMALLKIAERALAKEDYARAESSYRQVEKEFEDAPLPQMAIMGIIDLEKKRGRPPAVFAEAERFLARYPDADGRYDVMRSAADAAWRINRYDRALALVDSLRAQKAHPDSTGELDILAGRILLHTGKTDEALAAVNRMRDRFPRSPLQKDALVLEAEIRDRAGAPLEAFRLYNLALLGDVDDATKAMLNSRLADLSLRKLADTTAAIRHYEIAAAADRGGAMAEEALFLSSALREKRGDLAGAAAGYRELVARFPGGSRKLEALERERVVDATPRRTPETEKRLARLASWDAPSVQRALETGAVLVEEARDAEAAMPLLEQAWGAALPDSLKAKAGYYLGSARLMRSVLAASRGADGAPERSRGLELLRQVYVSYAGSPWAERAQRAYLSERAPRPTKERMVVDLTHPELLAGIDEYLARYGAGSGRWWALSRKAEWLLQGSPPGDTASARAALAAAREVVNGPAAAADKKDATYIAASLMLARREYAGASRAYEAFVSGYPEDPRAVGALYDLGEALLMQGDYKGAASAYDRCVARSPERALLQKCLIRKGDCLFYQSSFAAAAETFARFAADYSGSELASEARYREALAREKLGEDVEAEDIMSSLGERGGGAPIAVRSRALAWLGARYVDRRDWAKARPVADDLAAIERSATNLTLAGEAALGAGDAAGAVRVLGEAIRLPGADTCRVLGARARAFLRLKDVPRYDADAQLLASRCAAWKGMGTLLLERGQIEAEEGRCDEAARTLDELGRRYPGTPEANEALFYLALCDLKRGGYQEAVAKLDRFIQGAPGSGILPQAYFKLGSAHFGAGNLNLAAKNYALAAESSKDPELSFMAWKNLGRVYQQLEQWNDAAATWQKLVETYPEREGIVEVLFDLGFAYNQANRNELAYDVYRRIPDVTADEEQQGRAHYWAGTSLKSLRRYDDAIREFLRVPYLRTGGNWGVTAKLEAAACYELAGDPAQAKPIYESVLQAHGPNSDWGRVAADGLKRIAEGAKPPGAGAPDKKE